MLKRLEANGLIRRERSRDDERVVQITLTDEGASMRARASGLPAYIGEGMSMAPGEFEQLREMLRRLTDNVERATEEALAQPGKGTIPAS